MLLLCAISMEKPNQKYLIAAKKVWKNVIHSSVSSTQEERLRQYVDLYKTLLNILQAGNYYYLLFDVYNGEIIDIDERVERVLGYPPESVNVKLLLANMHPDDKAYFLSFEQAVTSFFNGMDTLEYQYYKVQYDIRLKNANDAYHRILFQYLIVNYDEQNIYHTFHVHTDISHIKPEGPPCFSIIGLEGRPSYHHPQYTILSKSFDLFTRREREILKEIIAGNVSKQIAEKLHISLHTVNAHKRNIMKKAGVKSAIELVSKSIKENWI